MKRKEIVVIGIGRFGLSVVNTLIEHGALVTALDNDSSKILMVSDRVAFSATVDCTNEEILKSLDILNADHVLVSIGSHLESAIMTIVALKSIGAKNISAKASDEKVAAIFRSLGVNNVILPEKEMGALTAKKILFGTIKNSVELDKNHSIVQIKVVNPSLINVPIANLDLRKNYEINLIAIKRKDEFIMPLPNDILLEGDIISIIGSNKSLVKFENDIDIDN